MSETSTIRGFSLCHCNEYINIYSLISFPCKPKLPIKGTTNMVSVFAYEDIRGTFTELLAADKKAVDLEFTIVGENNLANLNSLIEDKITTYGNRFFMMNYYLPTRGWVLGKVYVGTPIEAEVVYIDEENGGENTVTNLKFSIIEVDGIKI